MKYRKMIDQLRKAGALPEVVRLLRLGLESCSVCKGSGYTTYGRVGDPQRQQSPCPSCHRGEVLNFIVEASYIHGEENGA